METVELEVVTVREGAEIEVRNDVGLTTFPSPDEETRIKKHVVQRNIKNKVKTGFFIFPRISTPLFFWTCLASHVIDEAIMSYR